MKERWCKAERKKRPLSEFKLLFDGTNYYRRKSCDTCTDLRAGGYVQARERELSLIPNPFAKIERRPVQDLSPFLTSESV